MTLKLLIEIVLVSLVLRVSGQFDHFPAQSDSQDARLPPPPPQTPVRAPPPPPQTPARAPPSSPVRAPPRLQPSRQQQTNLRSAAAPVESEAPVSRGRIRGRGRFKEEKREQGNTRSQRVRVPDRNSILEQTPQRR